jgi:hypothetical protein
MSALKCPHIKVTVVVGPGGHRSPHHRVPFNSRDKGATCVSLTWLAVGARPYAVDLSQPRIDAWNSDNLPIYEPGLDAGPVTPHPVRCTRRLPFQGNSCPRTCQALVFGIVPEIARVFPASCFAPYPKELKLS